MKLPYFFLRHFAVGLHSGQQMFSKVGVFLICVAAVFAEPTADQLTSSGIAEFTGAHEKWDGARFAKAAEYFQKAENVQPRSGIQAAWRGTALFYQMLQLQSKADVAGANAAMSDAQSALENAVAWQANIAEAHALLATLYGMKIQKSPLQAMRLGPALLKHRKLAEQHGPANPRVRYLFGTAQFHTAKNDAARREALATLLAAETLFQAEAKKKPARWDHRWGHADCLSSIASCYEALQQKPEALAYFKKALAAHPANQMAKAGIDRLKKP
jgi:tetratricopeptide (TPR) repeat protein